MGSLLATLATLVVTALAALLAVPHFVDWNDYKAQFEAQAAKLVGRPVAIQGDIDLTVLPIPRLSLRGLRISDEFGRFERPFVEVETLNAVLSLPPLLRGTIEANSIELDQPIIRLKTDSFGEGTWLSVGPHGLTIPLPVREVVLNKVDITDGAIELRRAQGSAARFDRLSGSFSADSLSGPFRFNGVGDVGGGTKKIQLAAVKSEDKPALRLKGALRSMDGVSLYQLDGEIRGLDGPIHYEGPVAARLALDQTAKKAESDQIAEPLPGKAIEMRAKAKITLEDAKLDDINLTVTQNDRPQSVTGWAHASWKDAPRLDLSVEASWLDIDQMMSAEADAAQRPVPTMVIAALPRVFEGWSFKPRQGQINARIKQAALNGDVVENVDFVASHDANGWKIDTLVAKLPGETELDVKGILPAGDALAFNGSFVLKGKNLSRLIRWSAPSLGFVDTGNVETFDLSSAVTLTPGQLAFRNAKGSLGDSSFTGDLVHDHGETSKLLLAVESERLDLRSLYRGRNALGSPDGEGEVVDLAAIEPSGPLNSWSPQTISTRKTSLIDVLATVFKADQSNVSLLISRLQLPDFEARDVRSAFRYENGTFDFRELNVATTDGLKVKASGRITGFDSKPDGALKLSIDAPSAQSVTNLAQLIGLDSVGRAARRRIEALSPFQLSGRFEADDETSLTKLTMAGTAGGSELTFNGQMRGSFETPGEAEVTIDGGIGNANGHRLIAQLAPEVPLERATAQKGSGYLKIATNGTVKSGLESRIELQTPQARGQFNGTIALLAEPSWGIKGSLDMRASQAATALSMLRMSPGGTPVTGAIDLEASVTKQGHQYDISDLALVIGGETIRGTASVDVAGNRPNANINIKAASVMMPKVAAYLVNWDQDDLTSKASNGPRRGQSVWPNQAFSISSLQAFDGRMEISAPVFVLSDGLRLSDGVLKASLDAGGLRLSKLEGGIYGGTLSASGMLTGMKGRAGFSGQMELRNADLAAMSRANGGSAVVEGKADLALSVDGQGLSPRGLISVISGKGEMTLSRGTIDGLSPAVLQSAASAYLTEEIPDKEALSARLETDFLEGRLSYPKVTAPIAIRDGVLRIPAATIDGEGYQAEADLTVDLASFRFDSEWIIDGEGKTEDDLPLPPVRMVFAGPLGQFSSVKPRLDTDQFERFLTIKRMDQDMDRLEQLSRERRRQEERDRQQRSGSQAEARSDVEPDQPGASEAAERDNAAIPTHSLLRGTPAQGGSVEAPASAGRDEANARAPAPPTEPLSGWSTGTETTTEAPPADDWQARSDRDAEPAPDFESQIREVLRSQQNENRPAYQ